MDAAADVSADPESVPLTVVLPCHNEGGQVEVAYRAIDDGSTDDTLTRMRELTGRDPRVRYLSFGRSFGPAAHSFELFGGQAVLLAALAVLAGYVHRLVRDAPTQHAQEPAW
jgi:hypothetical protein